MDLPQLKPGDKLGSDREEFAFWLVVLLVFFLVLGQNFFANEGVILISALFSTGLFLYLVRFKTLLFPKGFTILYLFFVGTNLISLFFSTSPYLAFLRVIELISFFYLAILGFNLFQNKKLQSRFLLFFIFLSSSVSLLSLYNFQDQHPNFTPSHSTQWPFNWPDLLSSFILLSLPFFVWEIFKKQGKTSLSLKFLLMVVFVLSLLLTKSSWSLLNFALLSFFLFFIFRKNLARVWPIIFALAFVIFSLIYPLSEHNNIYPPSPQIINYQADFACRDLKDIRGAVWKIARQNFFFGQGPNSFAASYRIFQSSQWSRSKFAFNEYLQVLAENGFLGLVSFMAIIFYLFYLFIKRGGERGLFPQVVFASLFIFLFDNLNNFSFRVTSLAVIFWIIAGLFLALKERGVTVNRWLKLPAIIIFLLSLYLTINLSFFRLAQNYFLNQNNLKKASQILNVLSQTNPLNPDYLIWQASISLEDNNSEGTIGFLEKAANLEKDNPETYFQIGNLYHKKGENNKARAFLEKTIRLAPFAWPHYYNSLAEVLIDLNQKEEASALLEKAKKQMFPINQKYYSCQSYLNEVGISSQLMSTYLLYQELSP